MDFESFSRSLLQVNSPALPCRAFSNGLRDFYRGGFRDIMAEVFAQRGRMIGIDAGIDAGAGNRDIGETGADEVGMNRSIDVDQNTVGGESLGTVAGDRIALIEVA